MIVDGVVELDDQEFDDWQPELVDLKALFLRTGETGAVATEAMIDLCVAAGELCGEDYSDPEKDCDRAFRDLQRLYWRILNQDGIERGTYIFNVQFQAAIARWNDSIAAETDAVETEQDTNMITATSGKQSKRTRAKSESSEDNILQLRIEARLKVSGTITFRRQGSRWLTAFDVTDIKTKEAFFLAFTSKPEDDGFESEAIAVQQSFQALREWCEDGIADNPKERNRLLEVIEQLRSHEAQVSPGVPETQAEATAKEAAVDENQRPFLLIAIEELVASMSAMELTQNKIRKPVPAEDRLWVAVGGASSGNEGQISVEYYEVVPASMWQGETVNYSDIVADADRRRESPEGFYHGQAVTCGTGKKQMHYVLKGPEYTTPGYGIGKRIEESTEPLPPHRIYPLANGKLAWVCAGCAETNDIERTDCGKCGAAVLLPDPLPAMDQPVKKSAKKSAAKAAPAAAAADHLETAEIELDRLIEHPDNPRVKMHGIEELARTMQEQGQLVEAIGRQFGDKIQLLAGHRRLAAAQLNKWETLRVRIVVADDQQAITILGIDNEERRNFDALERARWYRSMLDTLQISQRSLSWQLGEGHSQGQIANSLALLELGEEWHQLLQEGKVQPSHTRALTQFNKRPELLSQLAAKYTEYLVEQPADEITTRDFERFVYAAVKQIGRMLKDQFGTARVKVTDKNRDELDIIEIPRSWGGTEQIVMNTQVFDETLKQAKKKEKKKAKQEELKQASPSGSGAKSCKPAAPSFDQHAVEEAKERWIYLRLAEAIEKLPKKERALPLKLFLSMSGTEAMYEVTSNRTIIASVLGVTLKESTQRFLKQSQLWELLAELDASALEQAIRRVCAQAFRERADSHYLDLFEDAETLAGICSMLGVDLASEYVPTADVLDLYSLDVLKELPAAERMKEADEAGFEELSAEKETFVLALISEWTPGERPPGME